ncbi:hypothetical protein TNCV_4890401 [Trichonephila clavipes]|nr:hypothetical protein TNCV_4890401 [Trichonephila clavipes]
MRRNEGRVVNTPLVFKRALFQGKEKSEERREEREGEETRGEDRRDGEKKRAESGNWSEKDDERRWR